MKKVLSKMLSILVGIAIAFPPANIVSAVGIIDARVTPINNAVGTPDTVTVTNLSTGDVVKVYSSVGDEKPIGTASAKAAKGESTATANVSIPQMGSSSGTIYVSVTSKGMLESDRRSVAYAAERQTIITTLNASIINNAVGTADVVTVTYLSAGDIVKVYSTSTVEKSIGTATAKAAKGESSATAVVSIPQIGAAAGITYITVTKKGLLESIRIPVGYIAEVQTTVTTLNSSIINNAAGTPDIVTVTSLAAGDIVKIYSTANEAAPIGTAAAKAAKGENSASAVVNIPQIGAASGTLYITVTKKGLLESVRIPVSYIAERQTIVATLNPSIVNNAVGTPDVVNITNLAVGDIVKVYSTANESAPMGTATAKAAKGESSASAVVNIPQIGAAAGILYVTVTKKGLLESVRIPVSYTAEIQTVVTTLNSTIVNNAVGTADVVTVGNLAAGDIVKVYSTSTVEKPIGTAAAKAEKGVSAASAVVSIPQIGSAAGTLYITVTKKGLLESVRIPVAYIAERQTVVTSLNPSIVNNAVGTADVITVGNLAAGDKVKVYSTSTVEKPIGTSEAKVAKGVSTASAVVSIPQIGAAAGTLYITITKKGLLESVRIPANYIAERQTTVSALNASVVNNAVGTPDVITIKNLAAGDIVKVYSSNSSVSHIGTAGAKAVKGESLATAVVNIPQIGASAGTLYVTITSKGLLESVRIPVTYIAERKSNSPIII